MLRPAPVDIHLRKQRLTLSSKSPQSQHRPTSKDQSSHPSSGVTFVILLVKKKLKHISVCDKYCYVNLGLSLSSAGSDLLQCVQNRSSPVMQDTSRGNSNK